MAKNALLPSTRRFFDAVYANNIPAIRTCLKRDKTDPNIVDIRTANKSTALLFACEKQLVELARALLKGKPKAADVNCENADGRRPIWWAAQYGDIEMAELLVKEFKCEVDYVDKKTGCTPLFRSIVTGIPEVCTILIHAGSNVNLRRLGFDVGAESPLMKAVQMNNLAICQALVNSLCDLNYETEQGFTALHYAIAYRRYSIVEFLLENKINKHAHSYSGVTPMTLAIEHSNPAMVRKLIRHGYNIDEAYIWNETPLEQSICLCNQTCALALVHWGCSLKPLDKSKPSYLYMAARMGLLRLVKLIIQIDPTSVSQQSWISEAQWPVSLYNKPFLRDKLTEMSTNAFSLKELCRAAIFKHVPYFPARYRKLPLPTKLLKFISFSDLVPEIIYKETPLRADCPIDCTSLHPWREIRCPDIEISDIDGETDYYSSSDEAN